MKTSVGTHPSPHRREAEFVRTLALHVIRLEHETTAFPLTHFIDGGFASRFAPHFYPPDADVWVEITTLGRH